MKPYYNDRGLFTLRLPTYWPDEGLGWYPRATWMLRIVEFERLHGCRKAYHFLKRHIEYGKSQTVRRFGYKGPFYAAFRVQDGERVSSTYLWGEPWYCLGTTPRWCGPFDVYSYCLHEIPPNFIHPKIEDTLHVPTGEVASESFGFTV